MSAHQETHNPAHSDAHGASHGDAHGFAHPVSKRLLYTVFFLLVGLTLLTVVANDWPLGSMDIWVALGIATAKAFLVIAFFMHMWWEKSFNIIVFFTSLLFVILFIGLTLMDSRNYRDNIENFPAGQRPQASYHLDPGELGTGNLNPGTKVQLTDGRPGQPVDGRPATRT